MRRLAVWVAVAIGAGLAVACGDDATTSTDASTQSSASGAVDPSLFTLHPVLQELPPPCADIEVSAEQRVVADAVGDEPGSCLILGPAALDATSIADASILPPDSAGGFSVAVELDADGNRTFAELASEHFGERVAMLVDGRFVSAPVIESPEAPAGLAVHPLSREEAVDLVAAVGGDTTVPERDPDADLFDRASAVCDDRAEHSGWCDGSLREPHHRRRHHRRPRRRCDRAVDVAAARSLRRAVQLPRPIDRCTVDHDLPQRRRRVARGATAVLRRR